MLIAFVVVSSVFSFAALSTGLFSSERAMEAVDAGLSEVIGTLKLRGGVIAKSVDATGIQDGSAPTAVDEIWLRVANATGGAAIDLTPGKTILTYVDAHQALNFGSGDFTVTGLGNTDQDNQVEPGEIYIIRVPGLVQKLNPDLSEHTMFSITVIPPMGAVVRIQRRTPVILDTFTDLH